MAAISSQPQCVKTLLYCIQDILWQYFKAVVLHAPKTFSRQFISHSAINICLCTFSSTTSSPPSGWMWVMTTTSHTGSITGTLLKCMGTSLCLKSRIKIVCGLAQGCSNFSANAPELLQYCAKSSKWWSGYCIANQSGDDGCPNLSKSMTNKIFVHFYSFSLYMILIGWKHLDLKVILTDSEIFIVHFKCFCWAHWCTQNSFEISIQNTWRYWYLILFFTFCSSSPVSTRPVHKLNTCAVASLSLESRCLIPR